MGQSGSSPVVLHRGTDAEIEVEGFKRSKKRLAALTLAVIFSGGLLLMFLLWKKSRWMILAHKSSPITSADLVLIHERKRKETSTAEIQVHTEPSRSQEIQGKETQQQSHKTLFFVYKKVRYVWDESTFTFSPQRAYDAICTTGILACKGSGLTAFEVQRQRGIFGENRLTIDTRPIWQIVMDEASNPFYLFQVYAALVWSLQDDYLFPTIILLISVSSIVVTVRETRRQINSLQRSDTHLLRTVRVLRDGEETTVVSTDVVPGDVLLLTTASAESVAVTCDSVLLSGDALVDEAMLTGESVPVTKVAIPEDGEEIFHFEAHRHHVLLSGTKIIQIRGKNNENAKALVIRTGFMTLQGEMIRSVLYSEGLDFAFFRKYLQIVPFFFLIGLGAMIYTAYTWVQYGAPVRKIVLFCLDILTFVVPPVLPIILTTIRATAQRRLKKKGIYCLSTMHIPAAGAIDVFCFDKTGTLTDNELGFAGAVPVVDGKCVPPANLSSLTTTDALAVGAATCHTLALVHDDLVGNETDLCLFKASNWELEPGRKMVFEDEEMVQVVALAHPKQDPEQSSAIIKVFPFDPIQQCSMAIVKRNYMRNCELFVKGSAQTVLDFCNPGSVPDELPGHLAWYEHQGYRALAMASKSLRDISPAKVHSLSRDDLCKGCDLSGILLFENILKEQANPVLETMRAAGIDNVMVTGDSLLTALSVARKCQLVDPEVKMLVVWAELVESTLDAVQHVKIEYMDPDADSVDTGSVPVREYVFALEGRCFDLLQKREPELFLKVVHRGRVFARMLPHQKETLVKTLHKIGRIVGMCGDGCNDLGALRAADVGLSVASSAEKEASIAAPFTADDDRDLFAAVDIVREGRSTLCSYLGATTFTVAQCYTYMCFIVMVFTSRHEPSVSQYVFLDFVLSSVPILTFALVEPAEFVVSWRPPQSLMHPVALLSLISFLGWQALAYIAAWKYCIKQPWFIPYVGAPFSQKPSAESTTIFYTASWSCIAAAVTFSHGIPFRKTVLSNKYFSLWVVGNILLTAWFTVLPPNLVGDWLHLIQSPHVEFNIVLLLMGTINICVSFLCEVVVVQKLFGRFLWPKLRRRFKFKQCEKIEAELRAKPNWPPIGVVSTEDVKNTYSRQSSSYSRQSFLRASTKQRQFLPPDDMRILPGVTHHNNKRGPRENAEAMKDGGGSRYPAASVDQPDYQQEPPRDDPNYAWSPELDPNPDGDKSGPGNGVFQWFRGAQRSFKTFTSGRRGEYKVAEARESFRLRDAVNGTEIQPLKSAEDTDWLPLPPTPIAITDGSQPKMFPIDIDDDDEEPPPPPPPAPTAADAIEEGDDEESRRGRPVKKQRSFIFTHDDINETLPLSNSAKSSATTRENILQSPSATKSGPSEENNSVIPIDDHNNKSVPHKPERRGIISGSMKNRAFDETGASSSDGKNQSSGNSKSEDHDDYYEDVGNCSGLEYFSPSRTSTSSFRRPTSLLKSDEYYS